MFKTKMSTPGSARRSMTDASIDVTTQSSAFCTLFQPEGSSSSILSAPTSSTPKLTRKTASCLADIGDTPSPGLDDSLPIYEVPSAKKRRLEKEKAEKGKAAQERAELIARAELAEQAARIERA